MNMALLLLLSKTMMALLLLPPKMKMALLLLLPKAKLDILLSKREDGPPATAHDEASSPAAVAQR